MPTERREPDANSLLWRNVCALMQHHWQKENLTRLGQETGIGNGGAVRMRDGKSVGVQLVERVAKYFRVAPWQLFWPNFDPASAVAPPKSADLKRWNDAFANLTDRQRKRLLDLASDYQEENHERQSGTG